MIVFLFFEIFHFLRPSAKLCPWPRNGLEAVADPANFGGGGLEAKTSKIRMSSPKLRLIFRPKSEIQTFFSPKIRWSPKKKRSSPKLRLIFRPELEIQTFFSPKIRWSPKKTKKKGLNQN